MNKNEIFIIYCISLFMVLSVSWHFSQSTTAIQFLQNLSEIKFFTEVAQKKKSHNLFAKNSGQKGLVLLSQCIIAHKSPISQLCVLLV